MLAGAVVAALAVGCGPDGNDAYVVDTGPPATRAEVDTSVVVDESVEPVPPNGEVVEVAAIDNVFRMETIEVAAGTEVLWTNDGRNDHDVLPVDEAQDWGAPEQEFLPGESYRHVFDRPGNYGYYCSIHGTKDAGMIGTVVVTSA
jgi:plastocyanin